jgi:class 3 adenylate cyclase/tetratricopeptide (TPR) repeat protein
LADSTPAQFAERTKSVLEGERKHVTVLFADMKGSTELLADRDPEEARSLLDPVLVRMMDAVHRYDGTVNQVMGDGVMALFGAPLAHEDHAVRACYAALRMQESVKQYGEEVRRREGIFPQIRVGLNSGEVVVRSIGSDLRMDYTAVGQTTHLAARMEQAAAPGSTLITAATWRLAEGQVEVTPLGSLTVRGLGEPVEAYELNGATPGRSRFQALASRGLTTFIGRTAEIERLNAALEQVRAGTGQIVAVVGEPGIGKSRVVWEFAHSSRTGNCLILEGGSASYDRAVSFLPIVEILKCYFHIEPRDDKRAVREKVIGKVLSLDRVLEPSLPAFLALLDVPIDGDRWVQLEPTERRESTIEAVRRLLLLESRIQPLLLVVEDLHWIDSDSQVVLDTLADSLPRERLMLLFSHRHEYQHEWVGTAAYTRIDLEPLGRANAEGLLSALLGADPELDELKRVLIARTEGNPFFLEESVRTLVETNVLAGERGRYRLIEPVYAISVPATVHAVLAARIDRLADNEKRLLQSAAVIGHDVPFPLLQAMVECDDSELRQALAHLQAAEFLYERTLFPDVEYTFKHALTHEVTYGTLLRRQRRELHARIVEIIERQHAAELAEHSERLATHALRGELWDKATKYLRERAIRAASRGAYAEGLTSFEEALRALAHMPESRDTKIQSIDLRLESRTVLAPLGRYGQILNYMREAESLAKQIGDKRRLGLVLADLAARLRNVGDHERALEAGRFAADIASDLGDIALRIEATYRLAQVYFALGDLLRSSSVLLDTIQLFADEDAVRLAAVPPFIAAWPRVWLGLALSQLGRFTEAVRHAQEALRLAEHAGHRHTLIESYGALGNVYLDQSDVRAALRVLEPGLALLRASGSDAPNILSALGHAYALSGRFDEALPLLEESVRSESAISAMGLGHAVRLSRLAQAYLLAGRVDQAVGPARGAVDLARKHKERANEAIALQVLAEIVTRAEALDAKSAQEDYASSVALASQLGLRPLVAHCHFGLGQLYRRTGASELARSHLELAFAMYQDMGMPYWLERARTQAFTPFPATRTSPAR